MEKATDGHFECMIYHKMYESDKCWKTREEVTEGMKALQYKKDKEQALKDNIQMRFKGLGYEDCHVTWSKNGKKKTLHALQLELFNIFRKAEGREVPTRPLPKVPK